MKKGEIVSAGSIDESGIFQKIKQK